jgi:hypothetical protein
MTVCCTLADIPGLVQPSGTASAITGTPDPASWPDDD